MQVNIYIYNEKNQIVARVSLMVLKEELEISEM